MEQKVCVFWEANATFSIFGWETSESVEEDMAMLISQPRRWMVMTADCRVNGDVIKRGGEVIAVSIMLINEQFLFGESIGDTLLGL